MKRLALLCAALAATFHLLTLPALAADQIKLVLFASTPALPLYVARDQGFFAAHGLEVSFTRTPDSPFLIKGMAEGKFDVGFAGLDNFVAYQEDQHVAPYIEGHDLFVFLGGSRTNLPLVVSPDITSYADLKGKTLAVDMATTGFAYVMYKMLALGGLGPDDYKVVEAGATNIRAVTLRQGKFAGTLLTQGVANQTIAKGFRNLQDSLDVLGDYQGTVIGAGRVWARDHEDQLVRFIKAQLAALDWIFDPANRPAAAAILVANLGLPQKAAEGAVRGLTSARGLDPNGALTDAGVRKVLALRSEYAKPAKLLDDPSKYIDMSYYQTARR